MKPKCHLNKKKKRVPRPYHLIRKPVMAVALVLYLFILFYFFIIHQLTDSLDQSNKGTVCNQYMIFLFFCFVLTDFTKTTNSGTLKHDLLLKMLHLLARLSSMKTIKLMQLNFVLCYTDTLL